ncbi:MAG: DUF59 domain-containing protein [Alphaproteobacteria bacterium]|nr:DUF59 domain-containing protein [Alphaproteobacteria bacterium]
MATSREEIIGALKTVYDPEIPIDIWELGLVYDIEIKKDEIVITMTFTSPTCPLMEEILAQVKNAVSGVAHGMPVRVELVWDPPWNVFMMSDVARVELDLTEMGW